MTLFALLEAISNYAVAWDYVISWDYVIAW